MGSSDDLVGIVDDPDPDMIHLAGSAVIDEPAEDCRIAESLDRNLVMLRAQLAATCGVPNPVWSQPRLSGRRASSPGTGSQSRTSWADW